MLLLEVIGIATLSIVMCVLYILNVSYCFDHIWGYVRYLVTSSLIRGQSAVPKFQLILRCSVRECSENNTLTVFSDLCIVLINRKHLYKYGVCIIKGNGDVLYQGMSLTSTYTQNKTCFLLDLICIHTFMYMYVCVLYHTRIQWKPFEPVPL